MYTHNFRDVRPITNNWKSTIVYLEGMGPTDQMMHLRGEGPMTSQSLNLTCDKIA